MRTTSCWASSSDGRARRVAGVLGVALGLLLAGALEAGAACSITTTSVAFGSYDVFTTAPGDSAGTLRFRCGPADRNIVITLSRGGSATFSRQMQSGAERLSYNLYREASRTSIWGDGTGGTSVYQNADPPNNQWVTLSVYGRIPAGQDVAVGSYTDGIVATITF